MSELPIPALTGFDPYKTPSDEVPETEVEAARQEEREAREELENVILNTFSTPDGRKLHDYLKRSIYEGVGFAAELGLLDGIAWGFAKEGQRTLLRFLENQMINAQNRRSR